MIDFVLIIIVVIVSAVIEIFLIRQLIKGSKKTTPVQTHETVFFCEECGTKLIEGAKFCANCGSAVGGEQPVKFLNKRIIKIITICYGSLILIFLVVLVLSLLIS